MVFSPIKCACPHVSPMMVIQVMVFFEVLIDVFLISIRFLNMNHTSRFISYQWIVWSVYYIILSNCLRCPLTKYSTVK